MMDKQTLMQSGIETPCTNEQEHCNASCVRMSTFSAVVHADYAMEAAIDGSQIRPLCDSVAGTVPGKVLHLLGKPSACTALRVLESWGCSQRTCS